MTRFIFTTILIILMSSNLFAEVKLFLYSKVVVEENKVLLLSDIANIEGSIADTNTLKNAVIPSSIMNDRYIDGKEVNAFLKSCGISDFSVFGTAVRLIENNAASEKKISKGDAVNIKVIRGSISVETIGTALAGASAGENVYIRLPSNKRVKGVVKNDLTAEVPL